jgi:hypothetical protein
MLGPLWERIVKRSLRETAERSIYSPAGKVGSQSADTH